MSLKLTDRNGIFYLRGTVAGQSINESTRIPTKYRKLAEAYRDKREIELIERAALGPKATMTFAEAMLKYLVTNPAKTKGEMKRRRKVLDHFGLMKLSAIDQTVLEEAYEKLCLPGSKSSTHERNVYSPVMAVMNHAAFRKWCDLPEVERPKRGKPKTVWFEPLSALELLDNSAPHLRRLLLFYFCTGARVSEALYLDWRDVHLSDARVIFRDTKNGEDRVVRLPSAAVAMLSPLADAQNRRGPVFKRDDGQPYEESGRDWGGQMKTAFHGALRRAGLAGREVVEVWTDSRGIERERVKWHYDHHPHATRHSWSTWFYALTKDPLLLMNEGGWAHFSLVKRYTHLMPSDKIPDIRLIWGDYHPLIGELPTRAKSVQKIG